MKTDHIDLVAKSVLHALGETQATPERYAEIRQIIAAFLPGLAGHVAAFTAPNRGIDPIRAESDAAAVYCLHAFGTEP